MGHVLGRSARPCCPPAGGVERSPTGSVPRHLVLLHLIVILFYHSCLARSCWGIRHLSVSVKTPDPCPASPSHSLTSRGPVFWRPPITHMHPGILWFSVGLAELYPLGEDPTEGETLASWRGTRQRRVEGAPRGREGMRF